MQRLLLGAAALGLIGGAIALSGGGQGPKGPDNVQIVVEDKNPWTNLRFNDSPESFHFAIVTDRTGAHRPRVFSEAVERLNLMQPAFVVSVGDLIEGYTKDQVKLDKEWEEFDSYTKSSRPPSSTFPAITIWPIRSRPRNGSLALAGPITISSTATCCSWPCARMTPMRTRETGRSARISSITSRRYCATTPR